MNGSTLGATNEATDMDNSHLSADKGLKFGNLSITHVPVTMSACTESAAALGTEREPVPSCSSISCGPDENQFLCSQCEHSFCTKQQFDKHFRVTHDCKPVYSCQKCNYQSSSYRSFREHLYCHTNKFACTKCSKVFGKKTALASHVSRHHINLQRCPECSITFSSNIRFQAHLVSHTKKAQPAVCPECGKVLMSKGSLFMHRKIHNDNPKYECDICQKKFTQKVNLTCHRKIHTDDRPFSCAECSKSFALEIRLQRHQKLHSTSDVRSFQCPFCSKSFKTERCLKMHSFVHESKRPFVCQVCSKTFLTSSKLKQHQNVHTGARPFKCKYCELDFTNFPNWMKHTKRRHNVDHRTGEPLVTNSSSASTTDVKGDCPSIVPNAGSAVRSQPTRCFLNRCSAPELLRKNVHSSSTIGLYYVM